MECYLVGGAVRDTLLNLPIKDKDWVVIGETPKTMLAQGFISVGKSFPVFLHPKTKEEYALARIEKKSGAGHKGFTFKISSNVTLREDLKRRDLTINAMALDQNGQLIDPYHGQQDIQLKLLKHVSSAFSEDPLRVLRTARFYASLHPFNFTIAQETLALMQQIQMFGELKILSPERIWNETSRALETKAPLKYFKTLVNLNAFDDLFQPLSCNPLKPNLEALSFASQLSLDPHIVFLAFICISANHQLEVSQAIITHLRLPKQLVNLHGAAHLMMYKLMLTSHPVDAQITLRILLKTNALRHQVHFENLILLLEIMSKYHKLDTSKLNLLKNCQQLLLKVDNAQLITENMPTQERQHVVEQHRLTLIQNEINCFK
mgnify:CR=1 FL=1